MSSPKPPKSPDVLGAAREQGQQNIEAARVTAALNRVNQQGPGGGVTFTQDPNNKDVFTQTTTLSPEQQRIYNAQTGAAGDRFEAAQRNFGMYGQNLGQGIDTSGLPQRQTNASPTDQASNVNARSVATGRINTSGLPRFEQQAGQQYQKSVDFGGATQLPGNEDFGAERQRVEEALYGRGARRLDDQFARRDEDQRSQLLNRGLREGTAAYEQASRDLNESRTDAYGDLRDRAISAGGAEQARLFQQALAARQQGVGEELQQGQFANQSADASNAYGLNRRQQAASERGQTFGENTAQAQFQNQSAQQNFSNELQRGQFQNDAQQQEFMQRLANAQLGNQQRDAGINEQVTNQQQRLQGLNFLYGGTGAQAPQALTPGSSGQVQAPDIYGATQDAYNNQYGVYSQKAQTAQQQQSAAATAALTAALFFSDRRLKTNIRKEGELPSGLNIYSYRYKGDPKLSVGVMADEAKTLYPDAVVTHGSGYDMVDYGKVVAHEETV